MPGFNSDAYATGEALVALRECGGVPASDKAFQRGIRYFLETQEPDGTCLVHRRAVPGNTYLETGFPHGKFQIISFAGTSWATMALMLAEAPNVRASNRQAGGSCPSPSPALVAEHHARHLGVSAVLIWDMSARRLLEIGTSNGCSTLWLASAACAARRPVWQRATSSGWICRRTSARL